MYRQTKYLAIRVFNKTKNLYLSPKQTKIDFSRPYSKHRKNLYLTPKQTKIDFFRQYLQNTGIYLRSIRKPIQYNVNSFQGETLRNGNWYVFCIIFEDNLNSISRFSAKRLILANYKFFEIVAKKKKKNGIKFLKICSMDFLSTFSKIKAKQTLNFQVLLAIFNVLATFI